MARIAAFENDLAARESILSPSRPVCEQAGPRHDSQWAGGSMSSFSALLMKMSFVFPMTSLFHRLDIDAGILALLATAYISKLA